MSIKIKSISFKKEETYIGFVESTAPRDSNEIVNDKNMKRSDLPRHADFERAMDKLKPHLLIACELAKAVDYQGNLLNAGHFSNFLADEDEEQDRFGGLDVTGILIQGKHAADGVQLFGTKTTSWGEVIKLKTPSIPLKRVPDGWNYDLVDILDTQIDKLLLEAELYKDRKKHGAGVQKEMELPAPKETATIKQIPRSETFNPDGDKKEQGKLVVQ